MPPAPGCHFGPVSCFRRPDNSFHDLPPSFDSNKAASKDGGKSWKELSGLRKHDTGSKWQPGAGGMCLHSILLDPQDPQRIYVAISAAGAFRTDDGGKTWKPINHGLQSEY